MASPNEMRGRVGVGSGVDVGVGGGSGRPSQAAITALASSHSHLSVLRRRKLPATVPETNIGQAQRLQFAGPGILGIFSFAVAPMATVPVERHAPLCDIARRNPGFF